MVWGKARIRMEMGHAAHWGLSGERNPGYSRGTTQRPNRSLSVIGDAL